MIDEYPSQWESLFQRRWTTFLRMTLKVATRLHTSMHSVWLCLSLCLYLSVSLSYTYTHTSNCMHVHPYTFMYLKSSTVAFSAFPAVAVRHYSWLSWIPGAATIILNDILDLFFFLAQELSIGPESGVLCLSRASLSVWKHSSILIGLSLRGKSVHFL